MTDQPSNPTSEDVVDESVPARDDVAADADADDTGANDPDAVITGSETSDPEPADADEQPLPEVDDTALEEAESSIEDAKEAAGAVGANDDIPIFDDERAGQFSED